MRADFSLVLVLLLAGCANGLPRLFPAEQEPPPAASATPRVAASAIPHSNASAGQLARYLADSAAWPAQTQAAEIRRLQGGALTPPDRLKLAWLLARKGARDEELAHAQELLAGQENAFADAGSRQLLLLLQRVVRLEQELREERRRAGALQEKIDRLVELERSLHERTKPQESK